MRWNLPESVTMNEIALFSRVRKRMESLPIRMQLFIPFTTVFALSLAIIGCLVYYLVSCSLEETLTSELNKTTTSVIDSVQVAIRTSSKNYLRSFSIMLRERLNNHGTKNEKELIDIIARQRIGQSGFILVFNAKDKVPDAYLSTLQTAKTSGIDIDLILQKMKAFNEEGYIEIPKGESSGMARDVGVYFFKFKSLNWRLAIISVRSELIQLVDLSDFRDSVISLRFAKTGYAFIYNSKCEILAHPWIKPGKILDSTSPVMRKALVRMCDERNGFQKYSWKNPAENGFSEKLAIYKYIPEYDWIIGASISTNEIYEPIKRLSLLFVAICIVSLFIIFYISFQIASSFDKRLSQAESMRRENAKLSAAAKTTQMLAHDVRKPFAILQMILDKLQGIRTISELQDILKKFTPEAKKAIASVNGMINDVMEMGRTSPPNKEPASLLQVINNSLEEICRINLDSLVSFRYELKHKHMLFVDTLMIERVLSGNEGTGGNPFSIGRDT